MLMSLSTLSQIRKRPLIEDRRYPTPLPGDSMCNSMTSDFSKAAKDDAERADATPVGLINGEQLVTLLVETKSV